MKDPKSFLKIDRIDIPTKNVKDRISNFEEFTMELIPSVKKEQATRCMDCGIPFCHSACPLGNFIPQFNEAVCREDWKEAYEILTSTNNFPEFTGRICPAPCESSCVLGIHSKAVHIEYIEKSIIEKAYENNWVSIYKNGKKSGFKIAIVGSGPAGLACADQLNKYGHEVHVFEKVDRIGGLLRYGIPDFKLSKKIIDRRIDVMRASGIHFHVNSGVGIDIPSEEIYSNFDAIALCCGSSVPRDIPIKGRQFEGIYFAMEFLEQNNRRVAGDMISNPIQVANQDVVVIGGGDTGSDCIGTANRLGAKSITQIEILARPPKSRNEDNPWPEWPFVLKTTSSHEEGCERKWAILTEEFVSSDGISISGIKVVNIRWEKDSSGNNTMVKLPGSEQIIPCQKIFLAMGFTNPLYEGFLRDFKITLDERSNVATQNYQTNVEKVFSAGDMNRGQSLVVWAIAEGRECASAIQNFLKVSNQMMY